MPGQLYLNLFVSPVCTLNYLILYIKGLAYLEKHTWYFQRYGGWTFSTTDNGNSKATVWFNNKGWHAMPTHFNALSNMILRARVNDTPEEYGMVSSHISDKFLEIAPMDL